MRFDRLAAVFAFALAGCASSIPAPKSSDALSANTQASANRALWPSAATPSAITDSKTEGEISALLARMTVEQKVGQLIQADISAIKPEDMLRYPLGSILAGGNSGPYGNERASAAQWKSLVDAFRDVSRTSGAGIPILFGVDAVHGHSNLPEATIFPHNIGLGAARDADLIQRIGAAPAAEISGSGIEWTFAPTLAVPQDLRWGRTYEGYSSDPALIADYARAMTIGLQGPLVAGKPLEARRVAATAKHFLADGGTMDGRDQGDAQIGEAELIAKHAQGYPAAIDAGALTVMASFSSWNGVKHHGNASLLTGVLKDRMGFAGLVVGDWNGHGQVKGCTNSDCPQSLMAGLDVYMVPEDWKALHANLVREVKDGTIPMSRLDEAVLRVLRLKADLGIFDGEVKPSARANGGKWELLGSPEHRALAREAVAKSQVILKNAGVLPLKPGARIEVAGSAADNIPQQAGGWSITWQGGGDLTAADFPGATSIYSGIAAAAKAAGGEAVLAPSGSAASKPDIAIVVFGEQPYAEFAGDRKDLAFRDEEGLNLLKAYRARGVPTVAVFLSGRPLWVNRELNAADAFVAAWLPGSEGAGVADVLFGAAKPAGRLSFSWPKTCEGAPLNSPDLALFPVGYGLGFAAPRIAQIPLDESCAALTQDAGAVWFASGKLGAQVQAVADNALLPDLRGAGNGVVVTGVDKKAQEDARRIAFGPGAKLALSGPASGAAWRISYQVSSRPAGPVTVTAGGKALDITQGLAVAEGKGWREMVLTPACLGETGGKLTFASEAPFAFQISDITRDESAVSAECSF